MKRVIHEIAAAAVLSLFLLPAGAALACTWAVYSGGTSSVVARTMDWYSDDGAVVEGHGRNVAVKAADTPNALEYKSKYASIQIRGGVSGLVSEAMNEKGLQCSLLFLDGSQLPVPSPQRRDVGIANFVSYIVSNFATVNEALAALPSINVYPAAFHSIQGSNGPRLDYETQNTPLHFAVADTGGDRAVIEFIDGAVKVYHGSQYDAMTNEPHYDVHLYLDSAGYQPNGTNLPVDRRARARMYLADMRARKVDGSPRTLLAMRGLLATVNAGTEQVDPVENEVYPTMWSVLADQENRAYYLSRYNTWNTEYYDFSMFPFEQAKVVKLKTTAKPPVIK